MGHCQCLSMHTKYPKGKSNQRPWGTFHHKATTWAARLTSSYQHNWPIAVVSVDPASSESKFTTFQQQLLKLEAPMQNDTGWKTQVRHTRAAGDPRWLHGSIKNTQLAEQHQNQGQGCRQTEVHAAAAMPREVGSIEQCWVLHHKNRCACSAH